MISISSFSCININVSMPAGLPTASFARLLTFVKKLVIITSRKTTYSSTAGMNYVTRLSAVHDATMYMGTMQWILRKFNLPQIIGRSNRINSVNTVFFKLLAAMCTSNSIHHYNAQTWMRDVASNSLVHTDCRGGSGREFLWGGGLEGVYCRAAENTTAKEWNLLQIMPQ